METQVKKLDQLIKSADRILITSHISPDPDAVSSALLLGRTLVENYPDKDVSIVLEEKPVRDLSFLEGYNQIRFDMLDNQLVAIEPDLLIIVDANNYERVSRLDAKKVRHYLSSRGDKTTVAIIDHHELEGADDVDAFINNKRSATVEEIYIVCFDTWGLKKPPGYASITLLGIVSDTQRHRFDHPGYRETYRIVSQLLDDGASIEKLEAKLEHYNKNELTALSHLAANITDSGLGYTFSYIDDVFFRDWQSSHKPIDDLKNACDEFVNRYIRRFEDNYWGFIIHPESESGPGWWGVSLRAVSDSKDVSKVARVLGGGGHKPAAGAKVKAGSVKEAIKLVKKAIANTAS